MRIPMLYCNRCVRAWAGLFVDEAESEILAAWEQLSAHHRCGQSVCFQDRWQDSLYDVIEVVRAPAFPVNLLQLE